ncbi:glycoside hydrolase family protein [Parvularcula sp. ZS-1/3]|uniref:Lysozyme n=1 Tax=Parvularcula mediterranea TaxID=2732508 RepID=A0A7Y3RIZ1_9PROT|nr:caspase family protein [Parvularcula mediterranea]NNU14944.1 glycoside hydrolase family protein [Parvularcula mediterranea]
MAASKRALVIGASDYEFADNLRAPAQDAAAMAEMLEDIGFELVGDGVISDPSWTDLRAAMKEFRDEIEEGDIALFYFSGHGLAIDGKNYLVPIDAELASEDDADTDLWDLQEVIDKIRASGAGKSVLIIDACRNDPFAEVTKGKIQRGGLAPVGGLPGMFIGFATEPGRTVPDGPPGGNSIYTAALLEFMALPNLTITQVFNYVGDRVWSVTKETQLVSNVFTFGVDDLYLNADENLVRRPKPSFAPVAVASVDGAATKSITLIDTPEDSLVEGPSEEILELAIAYVTAFEPYLKTPVYGPLGGGREGWVVGYGSVLDLHRDMSVSKDEAVALLKEDLRSIAGETNRFGRNLNLDEEAALLSFIHSIGIDRWRTIPVPSEKFNTSDSNEVFAFFRRESSIGVAGEEKFSGAQLRRRQAEAMLFLGARFTSAAEIEALDLIKSFEGLELEAYKDVVGVWTIGYGHTGERAFEGNEISEFEAEQLLIDDLLPIRAAVLELVEVPLTTRQLGALVSLTLNIGTDGLRRSTALKRLNRGNYIGAGEALTWWEKAGGKVRMGLRRRRAAELNLFMTGLPANVVAEAQSGNSAAIIDFYKSLPERELILSPAAEARIAKDGWESFSQRERGRRLLRGSRRMTPAKKTSPIPGNLDLDDEEKPGGPRP